MLREPPEASLRCLRQVHRQALQASLYLCRDGAQQGLPTSFRVPGQPCWSEPDLETKVNKLCPQLLVGLSDKRFRCRPMTAAQPYQPSAASAPQHHIREQYDRHLLYSCSLFHDSRRFGGLLEHQARSSTPSFSSAAQHGVYGFPV